MHIDPLQLNDIGAARRSPAEKVPSAGPAGNGGAIALAATESISRLYFQSGL